MITHRQITYLRRQINTLKTAQTRGGGPKTRLMSNASTTYGNGGDRIVDDLVEKDYLSSLKLRGGRTWVSITAKGALFVKTWDSMTNALHPNINKNSEETKK